ncbi:hypothetical protein ACTWPF_14630 [Oceanobacillus sp. M65]|uniref:hypothetical protein n=1 Tax=Oceanobacillus sp. M65 TaxID=3457435 RepID=UPI0013726BF5|nr:hypothetical protein [Halomonas sp. MG34]
MFAKKLPRKAPTKEIPISQYFFATQRIHGDQRMHMEGENISIIPTTRVLSIQYEKQEDATTQQLEQELLVNHIPVFLFTIFAQLDSPDSSRTTLHLCGEIVCKGGRWLILLSVDKFAHRNMG